MRFTVFVTGLVLSDAIRNSPTIEGFYAPSTCVGIMIILIVLLIADVVDLVRR